MLTSLLLKMVIWIYQVPTVAQISLISKLLTSPNTLLNFNLQFTILTISELLQLTLTSETNSITQTNLIQTPLKCHSLTFLTLNLDF